MTTLVTGASGGLGRVLCRALRVTETGDVVGLARRADAGEGVAACDMSDADAVSAAMRRVRPRLVYHLVGSFSNRYDIDYPVNALAARHVLEAAGGFPEMRVVLMGSAAEYGVVHPEENPVAEDRVLRPVSMYGLTKSFQTGFAGYYAHAHGRDAVVARMFNLMAHGLSERLFVGRVERLIEAYRNGDARTIEVGNLDSRRDYVSADDAVVQLRAIAARGLRGGVYHVASGTAISMRELLHRMLDAAGVPRDAVIEAAPNAGGRAGYDVPLIFADMRRTRALAGAAA
jgi:GDP-4-dehydro-6-deoxy-D-mannose reductase